MDVKIRLMDLCVHTAVEWHRGQYDKNGRPYIMHPMAVASMMDTDEEIMVALMHDTLEDTELTMDDIKQFLPVEIVAAIDAITRRDGEQYFDYIRRVKKNPLATKVKLKDIEHNMWPNRECAETKGLRKKYLKAKEMLTNDED